MYLYLPVAEVSVFLPYIMVLAIFVGALSGLLGISGGFILTPFMIALGVPSSIAVGSAGAQIFASSYSAVSNAFKRKLIPWRHSFFLSLGGLIGSLVGVLIFQYLNQNYDIEFVIRFGFIILLLFVLILLLKKPNKIDQHLAKQKQNYYLISFFITGLCIGILSGILGIGGGFLIVPILIYFLSVPAHRAVILSQTNILFVSVIALFSHSVLNQNLDPVLSLIFVFCGSLGSMIGIKFGSRINPDKSRYIFALIIILTIGILINDIINQTRLGYSVTMLMEIL